MLFTPFVSLYLKERQLDRREQKLECLYADLNGTVQMTEEIARRIEENLHQQQQIMSSLQVYLQETNQLPALVPPPIELPLEQAPSP